MMRSDCSSKILARELAEIARSLRDYVQPEQVAALRDLLGEGVDYSIMQDACAQLLCCVSALAAVKGERAIPKPFSNFVCQIDALTQNAKLLDALSEHIGDTAGLLRFYETFLQCYDPTSRSLRGVYYTPEPVVSYIIRSVDCLLQKEFVCGIGSARVIDPAAGTGCFLHGLLDYLNACQGGTLQVSNDLEITGCELMPASCALANLTLSLRARSVVGPNKPIVRMGSALVPQMWNLPQRPPLVVMGNPPYAGHSANDSQWIADLLRGQDSFVGEPTASYFDIDGLPIRERNSKWLNDDYVKFIRLAQRLIEQSGGGVVAFITSHSYLDNPTFRAMRRSLVDFFNYIYVLDLHGSVKKCERSPNGAPDGNLFNIQSGIAIGLFVRSSGACGECRVYHSELWGSRDSKLEWLAENDLSTTDWKQVPIEPSSWHFVPHRFDLAEEYASSWRITDAMPVNSVGIATARDTLTIHQHREEVMQTLSDLIGMSAEKFRAKYRLGPDSDDWSIERARADVMKFGVSDDHIVPVLYRPFDIRYTYYTGVSSGFHCRPRSRVMRHLLDGSNIALAVGRAGQVTGSNIWDVVFCSKHIVDLNLFRRGGATVMPLWVKGESDACAVNFDSEFLQEAEDKLGRKIEPTQLFHYIYALLYSNCYRRRYAAFLKSDYPRVLLTCNADLFDVMAQLGNELVWLHTMQSEPAAGSVDLGEEVINYTIGGYRLIRKWYSRRKGGSVSSDEEISYHHMINAISRTIELSAIIDETIDSHGGWPIC